MRRVRKGFAALRTVALATLLVAAGWATPAVGQEAPTGTPVGADWLPTRAGTEIKNVATADYTDANGNAYASVADSVTVAVDSVPLWTVALIGQDSVIVTGGETYTYYFQVTNLSNFTDYPILTDPLAGTDNVTLVEYCYTAYDEAGVAKAGGPYCFATLADLQAHLEANPLDIHEYIVLSATVTVLADQGGFDDTITVTALSPSDPTGTPGSDSVTLYVGEVTVTAEVATVDQLPSNGVEYTATFTVYNDQVNTVTYDLTDAIVGDNLAGLTILRLVLCSDPTTVVTSVAIAPDGSVDVCIIYTVADNAAGTTGELQLTATDSQYGTITDLDSTVVTIIRPALTISKRAFRDDSGAFGASEILDMGLVIPGEYFWYEITVTNTGTAPAVDVEVVDALPVYLAGNEFPLNYISHTADVPSEWTITTSDANALTGLVLTGELTPPIPVTDPDTARFIRIRVQVR